MPNQRNGRLTRQQNPRLLRTLLNAASRPAECEANAVRKIVRLVARTGCRTHILHVSSGLSVDVLRRAKAEGLPVSAETCPHYLTLDCDHIPDNATAVKCCPPIRDLHEQDALWAGLADGTLDGVVTDHSPASADMKAGTLATAWGGVSSLQVGFRAVLTGAMRRGLSLADVCGGCRATPHGLWDLTIVAI